MIIKTNPFAQFLPDPLQTHGRRHCEGQDAGEPGARQRREGLGGSPRRCEEVGQEGEVKTLIVTSSEPLGR